MRAQVVAIHWVRLQLLSLCLILLSSTHASALVTHKAQGQLPHKASAQCFAKLALSDYKTIDLGGRTNLTTVLGKYGIARGEADAAIKVLKRRAGLKAFPDFSRLIVVRRVDGCNAQRAELVSLTLATNRVG